MDSPTLPHQLTNSKLPKKIERQSLDKGFPMALTRCIEIRIGHLVMDSVVLQGEALIRGKAGTGSIVGSEMQFRCFSDLQLFAHALRVFSGDADLPGATTSVSTMADYKEREAFSSAKSSGVICRLFLLFYQVTSSAAKFFQTTLLRSALVRSMGL